MMLELQMFLMILWDVAGVRDVEGVTGGTVRHMALDSEGSRKNNNLKIIIFNNEPYRDMAHHH